MTIIKDMGNPKGKPVLPRRDERFQTLGMSCPIGEIVDLSASGMKIRSKGKPDVIMGQSNQFVLKTSKQKLTVTGIVAWVRRHSMLSKQYEIGIRFTDSRAGMREALIAFAKFGFVGPDHGTKTQSGSSKRVVAKASIVVENHYKVLGVERTATEEEVRRAFWALAKAYHPDNNSDPAAEVKFRKINEAHEVLRDTDKRKCFDQMLLAQSNAA